MEVASATDTSITATGKAGLGMGSIIYSSCDMSAQEFDNFSVNNLAVAVPTGFASWAGKSHQKPPPHYYKKRLLKY